MDNSSSVTLNRNEDGENPNVAKKMQFLVPQFPSWRWWIVICIHNFVMFSLDADNRKLCIFHYELWRTFVVKVSLTQFHNFFWNFDTFKAWGGGVGESVLYVYMYVHIYGGRTGGDFFLCGACWTDVSGIKFPRNALRFCSFSLIMFSISGFPWVFNFKFAQYFNIAI